MPPLSTSSVFSDESRINWTAMGMLLALISNMGAGIWYASSLSSRVERLEEKTTSLHHDHELLVRMDERIHTMTNDIGELKSHIIHSSSHNDKVRP